MKLPFITRKKHDRIVKEEVIKARREQEKATIAFIQARWDQGLNKDGSRQKITFEHFWGTQTKEGKL